MSWQPASFGDEFGSQMSGGEDARMQHGLGTTAVAPDLLEDPLTSGFHASPIHSAVPAVDSFPTNHTTDSNANNPDRSPTPPRKDIQAMDSQQDTMTPTTPVDQCRMVRLTEAEKVGQGGINNTYILYRVESTEPKSTLFSYIVKRRFGDFVSLHETLAKAYPASILPPRPGKQRLDYLDRFGEEFIARRKAALERYLNRVCQHPVLAKSREIQDFLQLDYWSSAAHASKVDSQQDGLVDTVTDGLLNAFSKVKKPDERFTEVAAALEVTEENVNSIDKYYQQLVKVYEGIASDLHSMGEHATSLGQVEPNSAEIFIRFGNALESMSNSYKQLHTATDREFLGYLQEQHGFCQSIRDTLKARDQKQIDFESLTEYLNQQIQELERVQIPGSRVAGSGVGSFFKSKFDQYRGADMEKQRQEKIAKLETKIAELRKSVDQSNEITAQFSEQTWKELEMYRANKSVEMKRMLKSAVQDHLAFHRQGVDAWQTAIEQLERLH